MLATHLERHQRLSRNELDADCFELVTTSAQFVCSRTEHGGEYRRMQHHCGQERQDAASGPIRDHTDPIQMIQASGPKVWCSRCIVTHDLTGDHQLN